MHTHPDHMDLLAIHFQEEYFLNNTLAEHTLKEAADRPLPLFLPQVISTFWKKEHFGLDELNTLYVFLYQ